MERIKSWSLFKEHDPKLCKKPMEECGTGRCVECNDGDGDDIYECSKCGRQYTGPCNLEDECS